MSKLRVNCFSVSLDGYGAGPDQSEQHPLGKGGSDLHEWFYPTRTVQSMLGSPDQGNPRALTCLEFCSDELSSCAVRWP
jgi:hypothetical protein